MASGCVSSATSPPRRSAACGWWGPWSSVSLVPAISSYSFRGPQTVSQQPRPDPPAPAKVLGEETRSGSVGPGPSTECGRERPATEPWRHPALHRLRPDGERHPADRGRRGHARVAGARFRLPCGRSRTSSRRSSRTRRHTSRSESARSARYPATRSAKSSCPRSTSATSWSRDGYEQPPQGPGHYPETPPPGEKGTVAIAGHRTTYGAPFRDIDQLKASTSSCRCPTDVTSTASRRPRSWTTRRYGSRTWSATTASSRAPATRSTARSGLVAFARLVKRLPPTVRG